MKTYFVTLKFRAGCDFSSIESANTKEQAIAAAKRYAAACGFCGPVTKIEAFVTHDGEVMA